MSTAADVVTEVLERAAAAGVPARVIGRDRRQPAADRCRRAVAVDMTVDEAERAWASALDRYFAKRVA